MRIRLSLDTLRSEFVRKIEQRSGQDLMACYQCGKCSAGCPVAGSMDILPNQIIRLVQLGQEDEALGAESIWYCAACLTCAGRCPKGVDLAQVMEALREMAMDKGGSHIIISEIPAEELAEWPQQAFVGGFRKYTT